MIESKVVLKTKKRSRDSRLVRYHRAAKCFKTTTKPDNRQGQPQSSRIPAPFFMQ